MLEVEITKIGFGGLYNTHLIQKMKQMFSSYMKDHFKNIDFDFTEDVDNKVLLLELDSKKEYEQVN